MILDLSKATKKKCLKMYFQIPCWRKQMFGKESLDLCCSKFSPRLAESATASPGNWSKKQIFGPAAYQ